MEEESKTSDTTNIDPLKMVKLNVYMGKDMIKTYET